MREFDIGKPTQSPSKGQVSNWLIPSQVYPFRDLTPIIHLAWELPDIQELAAAREVLIKAKAFTGESDHGATKSVYGADPDGNEFELMVLLPKAEWGRYESAAPVMPLDWKKELR